MTYALARLLGTQVPRWRHVDRAVVGDLGRELLRQGADLIRVTVELARCPAERRPAPTIPRMFRIMVRAAEVLGLKPVTLEVALRDAAARLRA